MDYLLSVLVIIVIYLVINLIRRSPKPTYRKPEEERVNSLFNIASGLLKERGMQWLMLQDYSFRTDFPARLYSARGDPAAASKRVDGDIKPCTHHAGRKAGGYQ